MRHLLSALGALAVVICATAQAQDEDSRFTAERVFDLEYADAPAVSPDGETVVYVRRSMDRLKDVVRGDLWTVDLDSGTHRPLPEGSGVGAQVQWSPSGDRLLYLASTEGRPELRILYWDTGRSFSLAQLTKSPQAPAWSPDGSMIAFAMLVPEKIEPLASAPSAPEGAEWSEPAKVIDDIVFRFDGRGYLERGTTQIFVVSAEGGTPRQLTDGDVDWSSPKWLDDDTLIVSGNEAADRDLDPIESELYTLDIRTKERRALTTRDGPDGSAQVSSNGRLIAYLGYDDERLSYQQTDLYVMNADGSNVRNLTADYDRSIGDIQWRPDGNAIYGMVETDGELSLVEFRIGGGSSVLTDTLGGTSIGRPYASGAYGVASRGGARPVIAYTHAFLDRPAELAVVRGAGNPRVLTDLNSDVLPYLDMSPVEEISVSSSADGLDIEAWVALPPDFEKDGSFPLILEIHGGPFAMYGPYFAAEIQRYAAEGYVTAYVNPRGSTGYGEDFAQEIDLAYPGEDYDDLMSVVDYLVAENYVDQDRLFVTGGSGGGVLTAWIVGSTDRFAAAATIKPVINWATMALLGDIGAYVTRHWIRAYPWEDPEIYAKLSPITKVGNVSTPTLVMVGEEDWRTPTWEAEQFYTALKLREVDTALVRIPGASHYIAARPSRLIAKVDNIMGWFERYDPAKQEDEE